MMMRTMTIIDVKRSRWLERGVGRGQQAWCINYDKDYCCDEFMVLMRRKEEKEKDANWDRDRWGWGQGKLLMSKGHDDAEEEEDNNKDGWRQGLLWWRGHDDDEEEEEEEKDDNRDRRGWGWGQGHLLMSKDHEEEEVNLMIVHAMKVIPCSVYMWLFLYHQLLSNM